MTEREWREEFARRLRRLKHTKGPYNQKQLAELSGISEVTISHYLAGTRTPKGDNLIKLAKTLNCTVDELIMVNEMVEF